MSPEAPAGREEGKGSEDRRKCNKPLGFALTLDPEHPYLKERGIPPELVATFGLGYCGKGSMAGRVCIPTGDRTPLNALVVPYRSPTRRDAA